MKFMLRNTLIISALFSLNAVAEQQATYQFEGPVRLQQVLNDAESEGLLADAYWPLVRLVKTDDKAEIEQQRNQILAQLTELEQYWQSRRETEKAQSAALLKSQVKSWQLDKQLWGQISIENARTELASNPLLPAGEYKLYVPERPDSVHVYGVVSTPGEIGRAHV